jgi:glycosyltransferase involved in cell wall biosynthesis
MILIAPSFDGRSYGGIERVSCQVLRALEKGDFGPGPHLVLASNDEPDSAIGNAAITRAAYQKRYLSMMIDALRMPLEGKTGPVLCLHAGLSPAARLIARRMKTRCAVFLHGVEVWRRLPLRTRWGLAGADRLFCNSRFTLSRFAHWHPALAEKPSTVVPLGLSASFEEALAARPNNAPAAAPFILTVSRLSREDSYKGHEVLMDSVLRLREQGRKVTLVMVGSGDAERDLREKAASCGDPDAFLLVGNVSDGDLAWFYRNCSVFALLSEGEGFGLVFLEAMSQGRPCVAANADASAEIVRDGVTGRLVPPRDASAAARALGEILDHEPEALRMGEEGRRLVQATFREEHFIERLTEALAQTSCAASSVK